MKRILLTVLALCILSASKPAPLYDVILDTDTNNELDENQALLESMESRLEEMALEIDRLKKQQEKLQAAQSAAPDSLVVL